MSYTKYLHAQEVGAGTIEVQSLDIAGSPHEFPEKLADYSYIQMQMKHLMGQVLTIVDASVSDVVQRKAIKDLMRNHWAARYTEMSNELLGLSNLDIEDDEVPAPITLEQALGA